MTDQYAICVCGHYRLQHKPDCQMCLYKASSTVSTDVPVCYEFQLYQPFRPVGLPPQPQPAALVPPGESGGGLAKKPSEPKAHPHDDFVRQIVELAHIHGWKVAWVRPARVKVKGVETYRTPWGADGKGMPDLFLCKMETRLVYPALLTLWWEVKIPPDRVRPEQQEWLDLLGGSVVTPEDWNWIVETLR